MLIGKVNKQLHVGLSSHLMIWSTPGRSAIRNVPSGKPVRVHVSPDLPKLALMGHLPFPSYCSAIGESLTPFVVFPTQGKKWGSRL